MSSLFSEARKSGRTSTSRSIADVYVFLLEKGEEIEGVYNTGFENISILDIARKIEKIPCEK